MNEEYGCFEDRLSKKRWVGILYVLCGILFGMAALFLSVSFCDAAKAEKSAKTVRVAVIDYPNYIQMNEDGSVSGYAFEYLQEIQKHTGWKYKYQEMTFEEATQKLIDGEIDLLVGNQYTEERAKVFDYSKRDMGEGGSVLCVRLEDSRYCYNDYGSYHGIRIAALAGSIRIEQTKEKLAQYGVEADFVEYDTDEASKEALEKGEADAVLMSTIRCEAKYKILARINSAPVYFCTNKQRPKLKEELDAAMEEIHLDFPYYEEQLDEKYYGAIPVQLAFTREEKNYIASADPIEVAVSKDLVPVEYYRKQDGKYHGIVPDSFQLIAQYSGLQFRFVPRENMDTLRKKVNSGETMLIGSIANEPSIAKKWGVELTDAYFDNSISVVINDAENELDNENSSVVLVSGYPFIQEIAQAEGYQNFLYTDSFHECISMVESKKADIAFIPSNCADNILHNDAYKNLSSYTVPDSYRDFCIGVSQKASPLLLSILNKSIASMTKEQQTELLIQNLTTWNDSPTLREFIAAHRFTILMIVFFIAVIFTAGVSYVAITRKHTNQQLWTALKKADAANQAKTDFLARMSHDMRTPMNGILGLSYLMEEQKDIDQIKKELPRLRESGEYLLQLINDVLDVNKVESGKITLHPKVCEEEPLFQSMIAMVRPQLEQKSIRFHFETIHVTWTYVLIDVQRVKQIFINLLSNAIKFTPEGGKIDFIMEFVSKEENVIRNKFIVRDNGIGMSEEFLPKVFLPFAQENRIQEGLGGTGLGLAIVKNLVELMDGSIDVKSEEGVGSEFILFLNFPVAEKPENAKAAKIALGSAQMLSDVTILLCEDHPLNAQIVKSLLEKQGAVVHWKENGKLGLNTFAQAPIGEYDVILMDIRMPVMDGLETTRAIRSLDRPDAKEIPIIAMTANVYEEDVKKSFDAGMNEHMGKPIEPKKLFALILKYLHKKEE